MDEVRRAGKADLAVGLKCFSREGALVAQAQAQAQATFRLMPMPDACRSFFAG